MNRLLLAVAISAGLAGAASAEIRGQWTASIDSKHPDRVYFSITRNVWQHSGNTMSLAGFAGLTSEQATSETTTPVQFRFAREAGTISFEGTFKRGDGAGLFTFEPNFGFANTIRSLGLEFASQRRPAKTDEEMLFTLAMYDVSSSYIRSMQAEGYRESLDLYTQMRIFDVTPQFIHELKDAGYSNVPAKKLVALRTHGVDINYIKTMNAIE